MQPADIVTFKQLGRIKNKRAESRPYRQKSDANHRKVLKAKAFGTFSFSTI